MSAFSRANRRIIRRLGVPVRFVTSEGVAFDDRSGVFSNPEREALVKGSGGQLEFKAQKTTLLMMADDVTGINKQWRFFVGASEYYPVKWFDDGTGALLITLGVTSKAEVNQDGNGWR